MARINDPNRFPSWASIGARKRYDRQDNENLADAPSNGKRKPKKEKKPRHKHDYVPMTRTYVLHGETYDYVVVRCSICDRPNRKAARKLRESL